MHIKTQSQDYSSIREEYRKRFQTYSIHQLEELLNREVQCKGWTSSRGIYLDELRKAFQSRNIDISKLSTTCGPFEAFSLAHKVYLQNDTLIQIK